MTDITLTEILFGGLIAAVGYLLRRKDEEQAHLIDDLYQKHNQDAERLHQVELTIASDHYVKAEMDAKFDKLESSMKSGFTVLGTKVDVLNATLVASRVQEEINKKMR